MVIRIPGLLLLSSGFFLQVLPSFGARCRVSEGGAVVVALLSVCVASTVALLGKKLVYRLGLKFVS